MKGLSSLERSILECVGRQHLPYREIQEQSGLQENVCFNVLQALVIRGILVTDGLSYRVSDQLPPLILEEINGYEARVAEALELIEAVVEREGHRTFRLKKVALDERDEKIFLAMLSNLDTFLEDAHRKAEASVTMKDRKVIFWGMSDVKGLMGQIVNGGNQ